MARFNLTRSRIFGLGIAIAALAFAACGHSGSTPTVTPTVTPTSIVSISPSSAPCVVSVGVAYEPDAGNGAGFDGIQVSHFLGNDSNLCAYVGYAATPAPVLFASSVAEFALSAEGTDGIVDGVAVRQNTSGGYSLVQDVFGGLSGALVPAGAPYDTSIAPPSASPTNGSSAAPLIPDVTSVTTIGGGSGGLAIVTGPNSVPPAIVAVTSLSNAPPEYGLSVPFDSTSYTLQNAPVYPRSIIRLASATTGAGTVALARGQSDLLAFAVTSSGLGYQFNASADSTDLGTGIAMRGNGDIAFDPADGARALIGGTTSKGQGVLTLVDGMPGAINEVARLTLPSAVNSLAIASNGEYAVVGTNVGIVVVSGVNTSTLNVVSPFDISPSSGVANAIPYTDCNGVTEKMTTVYSVAISPEFVPGSTIDQYLVALGSGAGVSCSSGHDAALVAIRFDPGTGSTPAPTATPTATPTPTGTAVAATPTPSPPPVFVQNNMIPPPTGSDLLIVR